MPKGTRVSNCVEDLKRKGSKGNPYAICQAATHQSYATGKALPETSAAHHAQKKRGAVRYH